LKRRSGFANPGGYDYEGQLFREGIGGTGYVRDDPKDRRLAGPSAQYVVLRARAWIAQRMAKAVTSDRYLGIFQGLAVGDTQAMQIDQWRVFAATGTTHLMAISGLHISMIAALLASCGGGVARTSTFALTNATLPFAVQLANKGARQAMLDDEHLLNGLNVHDGKVTYKAVADVLGYEYAPAAKALG
jgi:predicted membrane metal-binding protein